MSVSDRMSPKQFRESEGSKIGASWPTATVRIIRPRRSQPLPESSCGRSASCRASTTIAPTLTCAATA